MLIGEQALECSCLTGFGTQLLDWIRIVTDGHFPVLVLCAGSSAVLQVRCSCRDRQCPLCLRPHGCLAGQTLLGQLRELVGQQVRRRHSLCLVGWVLNGLWCVQIVLCEGLRTVHGQLAHFGSADPLPAVQPLAEYGLETLLF